jgi:hypothetical protein
MSQNAHFIMFASDLGVGAVRIPSRKILTHFADIRVARALGMVTRRGLMSLS